MDIPPGQCCVLYCQANWYFIKCFLGVLLSQFIFTTKEFAFQLSCLYR